MHTSTEAEKGNVPLSDAFADAVADGVAEFVADVVADCVADAVADVIADVFADALWGRRPYISTWADGKGMIILRKLACSI